VLSLAARDDYVHSFELKIFCYGILVANRSSFCFPLRFLSESELGFWYCYAEYSRTVFNVF
jgi:hypothetical protein